MLESSVFTVYNLIIGLLTGTGVAYFLVFKPTVVEYNRFLLLTVGGLVSFLIGGPLMEIIYPPLLHWIHGTAALMVVFGLYNPLENELRHDAWTDVLLQEPTQVRQRADWMLPIDDAVLELFHSKELVLTPAIVAYNIGYSREEVNRRLRELEKRGFMTKVERGKYRITEFGIQYVNGSMSVGLSRSLRHFWRSIIQT